MPVHPVAGLLQVLWLADNYISSITGISQLSNLHELNLARNDIAVIGSNLQLSSRLTSLNLADDNISSLQVSWSCCTVVCLTVPVGALLLMAHKPSP
jgi:hypothetical protein